MDSDDEQPATVGCGQREKELNKLRSGSTSPSAISTASSGSPLVRGHSGSSSSGKRPAPTSIAAAQLQCQQSQLDFSARLLPSQAAAKELAKHEAKLARKAPESQQCGAGPASGEHHKSLGYRLAKSAAFRAYRLNELWSMNKMRYMNLACLLMTLICLVAILLLAGRNQQQQQVAKHDHHLHQYQQRDQLSSRRLNTDEPLAESIDSLDSQPLVIGGGSGTSGGALLHDSSKGAAAGKWARSSAPATGQREVEDTTTSTTSISTSTSSTTTTSTTSTSTSPRPSHTAGSEQRASITSDSFGLEPLVSRLFSELELGPSSLLDLLKKNSTKPIVKRTKNGATIIISASSTSGSLNDSSSIVPSLLSRMLPPFFRHNARQLPFSAATGLPVTDLASFGGGGASFPSESRLSFTASGIPLGAARFGGFFGGPMDPFMGPFPGLSQRRQSLFMEPPMGPMSPFSMRQEFAMNPLGMGPAMMTVAGSMPPPAILNMLLRAHQDDQEPADEDEESSFSAGTSTSNHQQTADTQPKNDTLNSTSTSHQHQQHNSSSQLQPEASEQVLDTVTSRSRVQLPRTRLAGAGPPSGSMLVFSGGSLASPEAGESPFMSAFGPRFAAGPAGSGFMPMVPQFVVLNGESADRNPISPMLKSLLGGLMSELTGAAHQPDHLMLARPMAGNKPFSSSSSSSSSSNSSSPSSSYAAERPASASGPPPAWAELNPDDDWMPASETSLDEQTSSSKHLRAHHRTLDPELNYEPADFLTGFDNIEKQILRTNQLHPLGPHTRSQSLSRIDSGPTTFIHSSGEQPPARIEHLIKSYGGADSGASIFLKPASAERLDALEMPPPHLSFIGRLLSELSRKPEHIITASSQQPMARGFAPRSSSILSSGTLGELEDSEDSSEDSLSMFQPMQMPSKRVRVRIRPLASPHEPVPVAVSGGGDERGRLGGKQLGEHPQEPMKPIERRSLGGADYSSQASEQRVKHVLLSEHPFTSPSSPLFGFPAPAGAATFGGEPDKQMAPSSQVAPGAASNRQQRSFTYHSNHEVAGSMATRHQAPPHQLHHHQAGEGRSREGAVLGRRLDDSPAFQGPIKLSQVLHAGLRQQQSDLLV